MAEKSENDSSKLKIVNSLWSKQKILYTSCLVKKPFSNYLKLFQLEFLPSILFSDRTLRAENITSKIITALIICVIHLNSIRLSS